MKAILEFLLPDDEDAHRAAVNGMRFLSTLRCLDEHLRGRLKYAELSKATREELEEIRMLLRAGVPDLDE